MPIAIGKIGSCAFDALSAYVGKEFIIAAKSYVNAVSFFISLRNNAFLYTTSTSSCPKFDSILF